MITLESTGCHKIPNNDECIIIMINSTFTLPNGFIYLKNVYSTIIENLRYNSAENFTGASLPGYIANAVIVTKETAQALSKVQQYLSNDGYSLVIYDAYCPKRAVNAGQLHEI